MVIAGLRRTHRIGENINYFEKIFSGIFYLCIHAKSHLYNLITDKNLFDHKYNN